FYLFIIHTHIRLYISQHLIKNSYIYICMYVCMYLCMYVSMYVCISLIKKYKHTSYLQSILLITSVN
ncbi:MAG: hypothetical protein NW900_02235, partial [Candidatus Blochmannia sp. A2]|nr:hypothetical protein [Candidatus Blochmannia sp. A2]